MKNTIDLDDKGSQLRIDENGVHIVAKSFSFNSPETTQPSDAIQFEDTSIWSDGEGNIQITGNEIHFKSPETK
ncbi:hypothetical protein [Vibrio algivorus]|uniref:Uncharacterized protein n=1 Tax=Vibrio algivorus TaxID=1667024 RepID=A0A557NV39_9VIBR|nr:hypothetical protein [Vibrio algivorus]TVO32289.1 hypothetical protein FOF44_17050 [Vibrio algivorus]